MGSDCMVHNITAFVVDPATVEPVAVPVMFVNHVYGRCPNCCDDVGRFTGAATREYCHYCGQRLDWTAGVPEQEGMN